MAHPDMDALLNESLKMAAFLLEKNGEFFPFGVIMSSDGKIDHRQGYSGVQIPHAQQVVDLLLAEMRQGAAKGEYRATAIVTDVCVPTPDGTVRDAIRVSIEHCEDDPVDCYLPYEFVDGKYSYGELFADRPAPRVFSENKYI